eukprot:116779_1
MCNKALKEWIEEYQLETIEPKLVSNGITLYFILLQNDNDINSIAEYLTKDINIKNKFIVAVDTIKDFAASTMQTSLTNHPNYLNPAIAKLIQNGHNVNTSPQSKHKPVFSYRTKFHCQGGCGLYGDLKSLGYCSKCIKTKPIITMNINKSSINLNYDNTKEKK